MILKDGVTDSDEEMAQSLKKLVRKKIGSFAVPQLVMVRDRQYYGGCPDCDVF